MHLLDEVKAKGTETGETSAKVRCHVFEDNSSALKIAKVYKFHPHTKHLNVKLHHFCFYVEYGDISVHPIASKDQLADNLTKPLTWELLSVPHRPEWAGRRKQHVSHCKTIATGNVRI